MHAADPNDGPDPDEDRRQIWSAVGVLSAGDHVGLTSAHRSLCERAVTLKVSPGDIAAFVLWNGSLPV